MLVLVIYFSMTTVRRQLVFGRLSYAERDYCYCDDRLGIREANLFMTRRMMPYNRLGTHSMKWELSVEKM